MLILTSNFGYVTVVVRHVGGIGLGFRNYRSILEETRWLGCWLIYVVICVLRNTLTGSKILVPMCRNTVVGTSGKVFPFVVDS